MGIVGRLTPIKNHSLFLESASALMKENSNTRARFLIVGDGELRKDIEEMTAELALADRVIFTGWIKDLRSFYADLDVLALTSNNEGTPVAVIEAMAAEVPVIATDVGGVRELISGCPRPPQAGDGGQGFRPPARLPACRASSPEGRDLRPGGNAEFGESEFEICERGVLVRKGDVRGFAKGLKYLLEHPEECREMGKRGREYALGHHSTEKLVSDMDRLYRALLERHSR